MEKENTAVDLNAVPSDSITRSRSSRKMISSSGFQTPMVARRTSRRLSKTFATAADAEIVESSARKRKRDDFDEEDEAAKVNVVSESPMGKRRKIVEAEPVPVFAAVPITPSSSKEGAGRKFVNKIITRTQSISNFVRNTPMKFGSLRKKNSMLEQTLDFSSAMDVDQPDSVASSSTSSAPQVFGASPSKKKTDKRREAVLRASSTSLENKRDQLQHSMSLRSLPTRKPTYSYLKPAPFAANYAPMIKEAPHWLLELGTPGVTFSYEPEIVERSSESTVGVERWYTELFSGKEHANFMAEDEKLGPVSISLLKDDGFFKAVIRTSVGEERVSVPVGTVKSSSFGKQGLKAMMKVIAPALHLHDVRQVKDEKHEDELRMFEANEVHIRFKWGVLYCKKGQTNENDMFQNRETSPQFQEFLKVLGDRVDLLGFKGYNGGLDTSRNATGKESVHTTFHGHEIMYHISTMIPYTEGCQQQLERKRHLGNDIVVIVFQEGCGDTYDPNTITTHFQHILAVVQVEDGTGINGVPARYRVQFARKDGVPAFAPQVPGPAVFENGPAFKEFLLTKLVNAERAALKAPAFEKAISRTRSGFLQLYNNQYPKQK